MTIKQVVYGSDEYWEASEATLRNMINAAYGIPPRMLVPDYDEIQVRWRDWLMNMIAGKRETRSGNLVNDPHFTIPMRGN